MTKQQLIKKISEKGECSEIRAEKALNLILDAITEGIVSDKEVSIAPLGKFIIRKQKPKRIIHVRTKEPIMIPETRYVGFRAFKELRRV